jgi:hypothetical protein
MEKNKYFDKTGLIKSVIAILLIICFIVWKKCFSPTLEEKVFKEALPMEFHGKVDSVYRDKGNHNGKYVILSSGYRYGIYADWEDDINLGDSLSKTKGDLKVIVYKKNGRNLILDYRLLVKRFHKDWLDR